MWVLIIGTGELGSAVLRAVANNLDRLHCRVGVLLRRSSILGDDPVKKEWYRKMFSLSIALVAADIDKDSAEALAAIFSKFSVVIGCSDYDLLGREISQDVFDEQFDVRALLRAQSAIEWVTIFTEQFMSFLFEDFFRIFSGDPKIVRALGSWENTVTVTDVGNIGDMTAEVVWNANGIKDEVVCVAGDTIPYGHLAKVVEDDQGCLIERMEWTVSYLKEEIAKHPENSIKKHLLLFVEGKGVSWILLQILNVQRYIQLQTVKEWLQESRQR